ncbi:hypothetical protein PT974_11951 [Cladobotryum mycophilum]|uniref:TRF2-interacting telomeric protein/Rap1 C-terminal domain-containing protein n=1 Tax=Cladobotryum mycophilum TaxID=491253 RepID=A0ABR0S6M3_9HYPO
MTPGNLAILVMDSLKQGSGVPTGRQGIWTDEDDDRLRLMDSVDATREPSTLEEARLTEEAQRLWRRLSHKHTADGVVLRREFLEAREGMMGHDARR